MAIPSIVDSVYVDNVTINGIQLEICRLSTGEEVYYFGEGWAMTCDPASFDAVDRYNSL